MQYLIENIYIINNCLSNYYYLNKFRRKKSIVAKPNERLNDVCGGISNEINVVYITRIY